MTSTTSHAYEWLKQLPSSLLHLEDLPPVGHSPPFPWDELSQNLGDLFEQPIDIQPKELKTLPPEELLLDSNDSLFKKFVSIHPLEGYACFMFSKSDIPHLISYLIKKEETPSGQFDKEFQESFATFLAIETLHTLSHVNFENGFSYRLLEEVELPEEPALCLDIDIVLPKQTLPCRLLISSDLCKAWKERFSEQQFDLLLKTSIAKKVPMTVHLEGGRVELSQEELKQLKAGDFVVLDSCTLQPGDNKGRVMLMVNQYPFMRGKIKEGTLKLLDTPVLETGVDMAREDESEAEQEDDFSFDDEINDHEESEIEDFDLEEENEPEENEIVEESEPEEGEIEELDLEEETPAEEEEETISEAPKPKAAETLAKFSPDTLPVTMVVEVGRLQLTLQKLLELQAGSMLELNLSPQNGVDLVINGKKVGRGELLVVGETLGIRILEI